MGKRKSIDTLRSEAQKLMDQAKKLEEDEYKRLGKTVADMHKNGNLTLHEVKAAIETHLK